MRTVPEERRTAGYLETPPRYILAYVRDWLPGYHAPTEWWATPLAMSLIAGLVAWIFALWLWF